MKIFDVEVARYRYLTLNLARMKIFDVEAAGDKDT